MTADPGLSASSSITIVSGLPRSGTSLVMQILEAAGVPLVHDDVRPADEDNPRGYFELDAVRRIRSDASFLSQAEGRAIKIVAPLLPSIPSPPICRVLFLQRDLDEVMASQQAMLARRGEAVSSAEEPALRQAFAHALEAVERFLADRPRTTLLRVDHRSLIDRPVETTRAIAGFLEATGTPLEDVAPRRMAACVEPRLHRQTRLAGRLSGSTF